MAVRSFADAARFVTHPMPLRSGRSVNHGHDVDRRALRNRRCRTGRRLGEVLSQKGKEDWKLVRSGKAIRSNKRGGAQLGFDGIDARETHYNPQGVKMRRSRGHNPPMRTQIVCEPTSSIGKLGAETGPRLPTAACARNVGGGPALGPHSRTKPQARVRAHKLSPDSLRTADRHRIRLCDAAGGLATPVFTGMVNRVRVP